MATKAKTEPAPKSAPKSAPKPAPVPTSVAPFPLASALAKAIKLVDAGKHAEAVKALELLIKEALATGDWAMKRRAQIYLALSESKLHPPKAGVTEPISEIQACLNRRDAAEAIKLADKAIKSHPAVGSLHYLRAVAFAQSENTEAAAESLKKAMDLDADFVFQWHMEPDFNSTRKSPLFAFTEGR
jgi:tetratricopeptide (TPR) repeat protein